MAVKNVFLALGLANDEATVEAWRSDLARIVRDHFSASKKSQVSFAEQLGIKQSVLSPIVNGNLSRVSVEFLLKLCVRLGTIGEARWSVSAEGAHVLEIPADRIYLRHTGNSWAITHENTDEISFIDAESTASERIQAGNSGTSWTPVATPVH